MHFLQMMIISVKNVYLFNNTQYFNNINIYNIVKGDNQCQLCFGTSSNCTLCVDSLFA
jgi:hypothetical protein